MRRPQLTRLLTVLALLFTVGESALWSRPALAATLPPDFDDTLVASLYAPTAIAFTPDRRLLVTTQLGQVRVHKNGVLLSTPALDLRARLCTNSERGLLGIAVDPAFASNRFIYLYYTFNKSGVCEQNTARSPVNRVARFVLRDSNTVDPASERILLDNIPSPNGNHNAGDLQFGKDGFLYVSIGDGGCDYADATSCASLNDAARDQHVLLGKVLRITRSGAIPASNPFLGADSARCNTAGHTTPGKRCQETFAWGLRNPFRMAFDPNAPGTRLFINDVGQDVWEEINRGQAGADYGWNVREGHCATNSTSDCGAPPAGMTNPLFDYNHNAGCRAITGGAFVPNGVWPAAYDGAYLFSDYVCGKIFTLTRDGSGYHASDFVTDLGAKSAITLTFGPYAMSQALYYTTFANGGEVRRIAYTAGVDRAPTAVASATPLFGSTPLTVTFDGSASTDPDGDPLTYEWDFGDGSAHALTAQPAHTYVTQGTYSATLRVQDGRGGSNTATVRIDAGNMPPTPTITSPTTTRFRVGQTITLSGRASDAEDGTLPDASLTWTVLLHHDTHTHPFFGPTAGNNLPITAPAPENLAATENSYLEIQLTATDSRGLKQTVTQMVLPRTVRLTFAPDPSGLEVIINGTRLAGATTLTSWQSYRLHVDAPTQLDDTGRTLEFVAWPDGGAQQHIITTPGTATTYTARFQAIGTEVARDTFSRVETNSWGSAELGGSYTHEGPPTQYRVDGSRGLTTLAAGGVGLHWLTETQVLNVDLQMRVSSDKVAEGSTQHVYLLARRRADTSDYRGALVLSPGGTVSLSLQRNEAGSRTTLVPNTLISGLTHSANGFLWLRMQAIGTNPTHLRLKAWAEGQPEPPAWQLGASDSTVSLQEAGSVGLQSSLNGQTTNAPVRFSFDDFRASTAPLVVADDRFARSLSGSWGMAELGGSYTVEGVAARYGVASGRGTMTLGAGETGLGLLGGVTQQAATALVRLSATKLAAGGEQRGQVVLRSDGTSTAYLAGVVFAPGGSVKLRTTRLESGVETRIGSELVVAGLTQGANGFVWLRTQVVGSTPTTLRVKAWGEGQAEPSNWQLSVSDSTASLQDAGLVGLRAGLGAATSNAPVGLVFDDLWVTRP